MVQEIAKKIDPYGKEGRSQDLYFIPRKEEYQGFMRVGDERRFVQSFPFEEMTAISATFKFVAGMNVGEKRRSQLGSRITLLENGSGLDSLVDGGGIVVMKAWSFGSC